MIKQLFKKCKESGQSEYLALLNWRNTPTEGVNTSPAQRFFGRRCKTKLPWVKALLKPNYPTEGDLQALVAQKQKQKFYYDRQTKPLKSIVPGEIVCMRLPGESQWSSGTCTKQVDPRNYIVQYRWAADNTAEIVATFFKLPNQRTHNPGLINT